MVIIIIIIIIIIIPLSLPFLIPLPSFPFLGNSAPSDLLAGFRKYSELSQRILTEPCHQTISLHCGVKIASGEW